MHDNRLLDAFMRLDPLHPQVAERRRHLRAGLFAFCITCLVLNFLGPVHAGGFDGLSSQIEKQGNLWMESIASTGRAAFLALAAIEVAWCAAMWAFEKDNMNSLVADMVKSIMTIAFFYALMTNAPTWVPAIHEQFKHVSSETIKASALTPDGIIAEGVKASTFVRVNMMNPAVQIAAVAGNLSKALLDIVAGVVTLGAGGDPTKAIGDAIFSLMWAVAGFGLAGIVSVTVLICYFIIAFQLVMLQVEMYLLMAAGAVFLGLGGSRWTREYVTKYLNHGIVVGVRYLVLMMVLSLTVAGVDDDPWSATTEAFKSMIDIGSDGGDSAAAFAPLGILFLVLTKTLMAIKAPDLASALLSGGVGLSADSAAGVVTGALSTASTVIGMPGAVMQSAEALEKMSGALKTAAGGAGSGKPPAMAVPGLSSQKPPAKEKDNPRHARSFDQD